MGKIGNSFTPQSLNALVAALRDVGCDRAFCKVLRKNNNSKQQIYLATDFAKLPPFPIGPVESRESQSKKPGAEGKKILHAKPSFHWLNVNGAAEVAPEAKIIYYPQFPEVRLSGFLDRCNAAPSHWMRREQSIEGRILVIGVTAGRELIAVLVPPESATADSLKKLFTEKPENDLFLELSLGVPGLVHSRKALLAKLLAVHRKGWIPGQKLKKDGSIAPYASQNSGGYTLEAECGVIPNGLSEPDYLGWELKQYKVTQCPKFMIAARVSVLTAEPDGGYYETEGMQAFVRRCGYASKRLEDRLDFTGRHNCDELNSKTGMLLTVVGYVRKKQRMTEPDGGIYLVSRKNDEVAASWSFAKIAEHWQRKHNRAVYVPSRTQPQPKAHFYCPVVRLAQGTVFGKYLDAIIDGHVFFDPAMKIENASTKPKTQRRSQFRIPANRVEHLYDSIEEVSILDQQSG